MGWPVALATKLWTSWETKEKTSVNRLDFLRLSGDGRDFESRGREGAMM